MLKFMLAPFSAAGVLSNTRGSWSGRFIRGLWDQFERTRYEGRFNAM